MNRPTPIKNLSLLLVLLLGGLPAWSAGGGNNGAAPDFTAGDKLPEGWKHDWTLGATGARGWMHAERMMTTRAREVYITEVVPGSPGEGVLEVGDVILGVGGNRFSYDPRTEFGKALTQAESPDGRGRLSLIRWRKGGTQHVTVQLPVLGEYSATAPYDCPKSRVILERSCASLAKRIADRAYSGNAMSRSLNGMALLASGDPQYLPLVKREAEWASRLDLDARQPWWYGYTLMLASEYVIATGDTSVLPGIRRKALDAANGQSDVGSWGHNYALSSGRLPGYGMINAPGVTLTIGLVLAREAGVDDPKLDLAIERSVRLLRFYVGKGSIPYGDHGPWVQNHDDNGKNGMAAILFNLLGDVEAATYFSRMATACHGMERDTGHSGNFFNMTWSLNAVALSGPEAAGAWMQTFGGWYYDLARDHDGTFMHQGPPSLHGDKYRGWDCTGAYLLHYAMPLKKTRLTGKGMADVPQVSRAEAAALIKDGEGWSNADRTSYYDALTNERLLERLSSWSPVVRDRSAQALGRRKAEVTPRLIAMLGSDDLNTRYGSCTALQQLRDAGSDAVPALIQTLESEDLWLRIQAAEALKGIGKPAMAAVPKMLTLIASKPGEDDPRAMQQRYLSFVLFEKRRGLIDRSLEGVDRDLLVQAVAAGLTNDDGNARSTISTSVYQRLSLDEIRPLLPAIYKAVIEPAPSGRMFASGVRVEGLRVMAKHHIAEGLPAGIDMLSNQNGWGADERTKWILETTVSYGVQAKRYLPLLETKLAEAIEEKKTKRWRRNSPLADHYQDAIKKIKAATEKPELIPIEQGRGE